jgi:hypothetical protein
MSLPGLGPRESCDLKKHAYPAKGISGYFYYRLQARHQVKCFQGKNE